MDYIWSPWRYQYVKEAAHGQPPGCFFCEAVQGKDDAQSLLVQRGKHSFVILNRFPYTSGHSMVVPYAHVAQLNLCDTDTRNEIMEFAARLERAFQQIYEPQGMNFGMNLGKAAGAGIAEHLHLHALPRWYGDTNFLTVAGETRVHPEDLATTYSRLRSALA